MNGKWVFHIASENYPNLSVWSNWRRHVAAGAIRKSSHNMQLLFRLRRSLILWIVWVFHLSHPIFMGAIWIQLRYTSSFFVRRNLYLAGNASREQKCQNTCNTLYLVDWRHFQSRMIITNLSNIAEKWLKYFAFMNHWRSRGKAIPTNIFVMRRLSACHFSLHLLVLAWLLTASNYHPIMICAGARIDYDNDGCQACDCQCTILAQFHSDMAVAVSSKNNDVQSRKKHQIPITLNWVILSIESHLSW